MVETQLCKLRSTSDTFVYFTQNIVRACSMFYPYEGYRSVTPLDAARVNRTIFDNHSVHWYYITLIKGRDYNEARERSEPFFLAFPNKKKHRVPKIKNQTLFCTRDVCVIQACVWFNIVIGHLRRPYSTHTAPMPVLTGSVHVHILTKPSRAGFAVIRLELIEPGAATSV